jgi:hypothetical protein
MSRIPEKLTRWFVGLAIWLSVSSVQAGGYTNLRVAVYFRYDNHTFIVQNFRAQPATARASVVHATSLHDLLTGETITAAPDSGDGFNGGRPRFGGGARGNFGGVGGTAFDVTVPAHSFRVFQAE